MSSIAKSLITLNLTSYLFFNLFFTLPCSGQSTQLTEQEASYVDSTMTAFMTKIWFLEHLFQLLKKTK